MQPIIQSINTYGSFSKEEVDAFLDKLQHRFIKKNEAVLKPVEVCQEISFLVNGSFRQYNKNEELDDVIANLFVPLDWILDHQSFISQKPSSNWVEAFEDSEIFSLSIHDIHELIGRFPSFFALGKILEPEKINLKTPEEKYLALLDSRPELIQTFPLKYIASYLEITPETLSRVRNKIR